MILITIIYYKTLGETMNLITLIGHIFMNSMIPIFMLIGIGFVLDKKFKLDLYTLSKLNFYILLPTFVFRAMYEAKFTSSTLEIVFCALCVLILNSILWNCRTCTRLRCSKNSNTKKLCYV